MIDVYYSNYANDFGYDKDLDVLVALFVEFEASSTFT